MKCIANDAAKRSIVAFSAAAQTVAQGKAKEREWRYVRVEQFESGAKRELPVLYLSFTLEMTEQIGRNVLVARFQCAYSNTLPCFTIPGSISFSRKFRQNALRGRAHQLFFWWKKIQAFVHII